MVDADFLNDLLERASVSERKRQNYDMRNSGADKSQRMLNALLPGTEVAVHRHEDTAESVVCLTGKFYEIFYEEELRPDGSTGFREVSRHLICPKSGVFGIQIPSGCWHSIEVLEPTVIFEAKDGAYRCLKQHSVQTPEKP